MSKESSFHDGSTFERFHRAFARLVTETRHHDELVTVTAAPLSPQEAIGSPDRDDFPLLLGKERIMEASIAGARGHAFTDQAGSFSGTLSDVLSLASDTPRNRAVTVAAANAVACAAGLVLDTVHCKDDEPGVCGQTIAKMLKQRFDGATVGLLGLNPAIAHALVQAFGSKNVRITDRQIHTTSKSIEGVDVWDAESETDRLIREVDVALVTGTTLVNGTFDRIARMLEEIGTPFFVFGVTIAAPSFLLGLHRICPCARPGRTSSN